MTLWQSVHKGFSIDTTRVLSDHRRREGGRERGREGGRKEGREGRREEGRGWKFQLVKSEVQGATAQVDPTYSKQHNNTI